MPAGKAAWGVDATKDSLEPTVGGGYVAHEAKPNGVSSTSEGSSPPATSLPMGSAYPLDCSPDLLSPKFRIEGRNHSLLFFHQPLHVQLPVFAFRIHHALTGCKARAQHRVLAVFIRQQVNVQWAHSRKGCCGPSPTKLPLSPCPLVRPCRPSFPALQ